MFKKQHSYAGQICPRLFLFITFICFLTATLYSQEAMVSTVSADPALQKALAYNPGNNTFQPGSTDPAGNRYVAPFNDGRIYKITPQGSMLLLMFMPGVRIGQLAWAAGSIYFTAVNKHRVYELKKDGNVRLLAGSGSQGSTDGGAERSRFDRPKGIAATVSGDTLYIAEKNASDHFRRIIRKRPSLQLITAETPPHFGFSNGSPLIRNDSVEITYSVPVSEFVTLKLYHVSGREIATLHESRMISGTYQLQFETKHFAPGIYYCRLQAGSFEQTIAVKIE